MKAVLIMCFVVLLMASPAAAQYPPGQQSSPNMQVQFHVPLTGGMDTRIEQDLNRPYVYFSHRNPAGFYIVDIKDPKKASVLYSWNIETPELVQGSSTGVMLFKLKGRYYSIASMQLGRNGPASDIVGVIHDMTGLPDTSKIKEVTRIRNPENPGGSHEAFTYKHSDGRALFFTTVAGAGFADIYDLEKVVGGTPSKDARVGRIPVPPASIRTDVSVSPIWHDFFVGYDPATKLDKFYGGGWQSVGPQGGAGQIGYYAVYDVSHPDDPKLLTTVTGVAGVDYAHTFVPTPDGRYVVAESEHQFQPLKIFDLKPGLDGTVKTISRPVGAWTPNWYDLPHQLEMRWPYMFVASYADGLHVVNLMDPTNPYTVGYWDTFDRPTLERPAPEVSNNANVNSVYVGAFGIDIRNADGMIVISDSRTGSWGFHMQGFDGWNGHQWGMPNVSSAQDWDNGPDGAPKTAKVS